MTERIASGPLTGITVVEVSNYVSGPMATMMLADLGADVIKVEPPRGDPFRRFGRPSHAMSAVFASTNRGKRSVVLDLKQPADLEALHGLLEKADVLLSNWRPAAVRRAGLDGDSLAARYPRLVKVYVSGYGPTGPSSERPSFDSMIQARSSFAWAEAMDGEPHLAKSYLVDKMTATFAAQAAIAALYGRERTGIGATIDVPMLDVSAYFNFPESLSNRTFIDEQPDDARFDLLGAQRPFRTSDGWVLIGAVSGQQIKGSIAAVGHPEWGPDLQALPAVDMMGVLLERIEAITKDWTTEHTLAMFDAQDVPVAACLDIDGHLADPQVEHSEIYSVRDNPGLGEVRAVRYPGRSAQWGRRLHPGPAPMLDSGRSEILGVPSVPTS